MKMSMCCENIDELPYSSIHILLQCAMPRTHACTPQEHRHTPLDLGTTHAIRWHREVVAAALNAVLMFTTESPRSGALPLSGLHYAPAQVAGPPSGPNWCSVQGPGAGRGATGLGGARSEHIVAV